MIARLAGTVIEKGISSVILDVNGVGYEVHVTETDHETLAVNEDIVLHTYFAVRENAQDLFGFTNFDSKMLFEQLLSVSGVGPKVALSISSLGDAQSIKQAIADENVAFVQSANGVGKRGAEKVIVELKGKIDAIPGQGGSVVQPARTQNDDAVEALLALGYSQQQAVTALSKIDSSLEIEERIKKALSELSQ